MGAYSPSAGVIYPTLTMLEEQAFTEADPTSEVGKRRYAITEAGRHYISAQESAIQDAFARMDHVARMRARAALPDRVAQAMETLKVALLQHGANWDDPQDIEQCAAILETAATALAAVNSQVSQATDPASTSTSIATPDIGQQP
jgi:DNA-binding PadR family transcriptional regulator